MTPQFSQAVWYQAIPSIYADKFKISLEEAQILVKREYDRIGSYCKEWYDIKFWWQYFDFNGDFKALLNNYRSRISFYPEVKSALSQLSRKYPLIISSGSSQEFLEVLLAEVRGYFSKVFSSISDYGELKTVSFYSWLCQKMALSPSEIIHLGDNWEFDFLNAKLAGIKAFYLDRNSFGSSVGQISDGGGAVGDLREFVEYLEEHIIL